MYISTSTEPFERMGDMKNVLIELKNAGFDAYDYSMFGGCVHTNVIPFEDWKERAKEIRKTADAIGIACNQSHAPFPTWLKGKEEYNEEMFEKILKAIEITGILGGKVCVVHPCNDATAEENAVFYNRLLPTAKRCNVKIGVENMWNWKDGVGYMPAACSHHDDFVKHVQLLDEEWFVANVDIGHAEMQDLGTSAVEMLYALKDRVQSLHIHDTDRKNDNHAIPFTMKIDFCKICEALKDIGYEGDMTLEVGMKPTTPVEMFPAVARFMARGADYMRGLLQNKE